MNWIKFIPPQDLLQQIQGIDRGLRQNKRIGKIGWIGFLISLTPILVELSRWWDELNWEAIRNFPWANLLDPAWWQQLSAGQLLLIPVISLAVFGALLIWKRFWLKESNQPFRYTFSLETFQPVSGDNADADPNLALLSHHLCEKINERIGRLLLLDDQFLEGENQESYQSHIHIRGHYTRRKDRHGQWMLEIMPRVRIGPPGSPETLAYPIRYPLKTETGGAPGQPPAVPLNSDAEKYEQILERLYFTVATEIYKQIQLNVQQKIALLPSDYFRAVALFYEAEDYARSNTLEAYDEARKLYQQAIEYFDPALQPLSSSRGKKLLQQGLRMLLRLRRGLRRLAAFLFPRSGVREVLLARAELGYARMLLYRRILAGLLGQKLYPVFETRPIAERAVERLENLPDDVPGRKEYLFEAYVTTALAWMYLGSVPDAWDWLKKAEMFDPNRAGDNAHYNFVYAEVEAHLRTEMQIFQRVVELEPRFEVAQFSLAIKAEKLWRSRPTLERNVAGSVLKKYEEVLKLNPGNVGAWANRGYIRWLLGGAEDLREARDDFLSGREYKEIKRETFVAELDHGLARIAAEQGDFVGAYEHYTAAASAIVTQAITNYVDYFFDLIGEALFRRYQRYLDTALRRWSAWEGFDEPQREFAELTAALSMTFSERAGNANRSEEDFAKSAAERLGRLLSALAGEIGAAEASSPEEASPGEWISVQAAKHPSWWKTSAQWKEGGAVSAGDFFRRLGEILANDPPAAEVQAVCGLLGDPFLAGFINERLKNKANPRVRNSILAFVYNDFGDACFQYYRRDGDERMFEQAREAYERAVQLNPAFVISFFNLHQIHKWKWDYEPAKTHLLQVRALEPHWPDGKLALAEVNARLAEKKENDAGEQQRLAGEKEQEIRRLQGESEKLRQEARELWEKIARRRERRMPERAVSMAGEPEPQQGADLLRNVRPSGLPVSANVAQAPAHRFPGSGFSSLPEGETPEEKLLKTLEEQIEAGDEEIRRAQEALAQHQADAGQCHRESEGLAGEALEVLESLLPHRLLWVRENGRQRFNLAGLAAQPAIRWEKELKDLHIHTLHYLGVVFRARKQADATALFSQIQERFWPTELFELRDDLKKSLDETLLQDAAYGELKKSPLYARLLENPQFFALLRGNRHRELYFRSKEYRQLLKNPAWRQLLRHPRHRDLLNYRRFNRDIFYLGENWALEYFYPHWALNYVLYDQAFSAEREGLPEYRGVRFKEAKDFLIEAARERNRSGYFYYWIGEKLNGLGLKESALQVWKLCEEAPDARVLLKLAGSLKSLERWEDSLKLYRRALRLDEKYAEQSRADYHLQCGSLLWIMGERREALEEFEKMAPEGGEGAAAPFGRIVQEILPHTGEGESYYLLKNWLNGREIYFAGRGDQTAAADAKTARLTLVREKYPLIRRHPRAAPNAASSASLLPVVTPIAIEVEAGLFSLPAPAYGDDHPLFKIHYPNAQQRIQEKLGLKAPGLRGRLSNSGMAPNSYIIMIMEVPIVLGAVEPGKRFLPQYQRFPGLASGQKMAVQPAYDPLSGEMSGAWIPEPLLEKIGLAAADTWDGFEYLAYHLEAVIYEHIGAFLDAQKTGDMLAIWQEEAGQEAVPRRELIAQRLPQREAKNRFTEMLHWLAKEGAPVSDLALLSEVFQRHAADREDVVPAVEAARLALRDKLPGNEPGNRFWELSAEFEQEIAQNLRQSGGRTFLALEPLPTQNLLSAVREALQGQPQWKTVLVTRGEGLRFYLRRLLEIEFPRVRILSFPELKPEWRKRIGGRIELKRDG